ncbi:MAG: exodeoxyribonuclease III [Deltaproteobacteria bacterium]|nr:exodeoxyribonuclease III [Deltaproteobacteria bacterium]
MMKIATFNANSIRARLPVTLDWLAQETPDILCIQETKVQDKDFPAAAFAEAGYHVTFRGQKSYNGVAIVSRSPQDPLDLMFGTENDEAARLITSRIDGIPVINAYVPQGFEVGSDKFRYKLSWLNDFFDYIEARYRPADPLIVTGDFNVAMTPEDVHDPEGLAGAVGFHPDEQAVLQRFLDWGLVDIFRRHVQGSGLYTFWDYRVPNGFKRNIGWRIDYILATAPLAETSKNAWIDTQPRALPKPSDHTFLVAEFEV